MAGPMPPRWRKPKSGKGATQALEAACDHDLTQTTAGAGILRISCNRCHGVELKPGGWQPTSGRVKARREIGATEPV